MTASAGRGGKPVTDTDRELLTRELGRPPRGLLAVAYRCDHGVPAVVQTAPRLPDGTPFPTMFYLCCSALNSAVSRMESVGVMREMTAAAGRRPRAGGAATGPPTSRTCRCATSSTISASRSPPAACPTG